MSNNIEIPSDIPDGYEIILRPATQSKKTDPNIKKVSTKKSDKKNKKKLTFNEWTFLILGLLFCLLWAILKHWG